MSDEDGWRARRRSVLCWMLLVRWRRLAWLNRGGGRARSRTCFRRYGVNLEPNLSPSFAERAYTESVLHHDQLSKNRDIFAPQQISRVSQDKIYPTSLRMALPTYLPTVRSTVSRDAIRQPRTLRRKRNLSCKTVQACDQLAVARRSL